MSDLFIGVMSGTSLDGIDAALVSLEASQPHCLATHYLPYPADLRVEMLAIQTSGGNELHRSSILANRLADLYAEAVQELLANANVLPTAVRAVGCHGQTIRHVPASQYTIQLNNPARLAEKLCIDVVADFRSRDLAAGGQGAPLVPAFHDTVFRNSSRHRVIVNIGGIANLTDLPPGRPTRGFDCGPGNMLLDAWSERCLGTAYDKGGRWAMQGQVQPRLLERLARHPFLSAPPPKSCGREEFGFAWLEQQLDWNERPEDVQATLAAFTTQCIVAATSGWCGEPDELLVCGGGAHNGAIMGSLKSAMFPVTVDTTEALGLPADWVEAVAFAWLAYRTMHRQPGNLPEVTGAKGARVLGAIYPG